MKLSNRVLPPFPIIIALAVVAMLGLQALLEFRLLAPQAAQVLKLTQDVKRVRAMPASEAPSPPKTTARLDDILSRLDQQDSNDVRIERLHEMADTNGVAVRKASYLNKVLPGNISRHEIQLDLAGTYPAIRQFLRAVLAQDEAAAVESLEFSRPTGGVGSAGVRAQVRLTLYSRRSTP